MNHLHKVVVVTALCLSCASQVHADDLLIDDFSSVAEPTPWPVVINTIDTVMVNETGLSHVLGGTRHSVIRATFLEEPGLDFLSAAIVPNFGMLLDYSSSSGADGDWGLLYDANGAGLNFDCRDYSEIALEFDLFDYANGFDLPVVVSITDGSNLASMSLALDHPGPQTLHFTLDDFTGIEGVDRSSIQGIGVLLDPYLASDFRLSEVVLVPTSGSLALLTLGSFAMVGGGRRRRLSVG